MKVQGVQRNGLGLSRVRTGRTVPVVSVLARDRLGNSCLKLNPVWGDESWDWSSDLTASQYGTATAVVGGLLLAAKRCHFPIAWASQIWRRSWTKDGWQKTRKQGRTSGRSRCAGRGECGCAERSTSVVCDTGEYREPGSVARETKELGRQEERFVSREFTLYSTSCFILGSLLECVSWFAYQPLASTPIQRRNGPPKGTVRDTWWRSRVQFLAEEKPVSEVCSKSSVGYVRLKKEDSEEELSDIEEETVDEQSEDVSGRTAAGHGMEPRSRSVFEELWEEEEADELKEEEDKEEAGVKAEPETEVKTEHGEGTEPYEELGYYETEEVNETEPSREERSQYGPSAYLGYGGVYYAGPGYGQYGDYGGYIQPLEYE
ncbi:unnamed protein product [Phytophthora fragariaefolia]|uniref:Unnamed protein product n=1 Tax=Phytophthora fragariaefolia TaxID=1490495 RepID=A0A9W6X5R8_9STRA|nr:unnamed protein product [Phytophthora fragariaefolia]